MSRHVGVPLLESVVLLDVVQVISSEDDSSSHLVRKNDTLEDSASDRNIRGEWALLVNVRSGEGLLWGLEAKANLLGVSGDTSLLRGHGLLGVKENAVLLLEGSFGLQIISQSGPNLQQKCSELAARIVNLPGYQSFG